MTYLSDPGNDPFSYTDAQVRPWRNTAGLWLADRNLWQSRAATAYDSGVWGTGNTWQTDYNNEVAAYNNEVTLYNNEVAAYNALLNGLTDQITTVTIGAGTTTLTIPKTGHYQIAINARATAVTLNNNNAYFEFILGGTAGLAETFHIALTNGNNGGSMTIGPFAYGFAAHAVYTAGQTITIASSNFAVTSGGVLSGTINAHWAASTANPT